MHGASRHDSVMRSATGMHHPESETSLPHAAASATGAVGMRDSIDQRQHSMQSGVNGSGSVTPPSRPPMVIDVRGTHSCLPGAGVSGEAPAASTLVEAAGSSNIPGTGHVRHSQPPASQSQSQTFPNVSSIDRHGWVNTGDGYDAAAIEKALAHLKPSHAAAMTDIEAGAPVRMHMGRGDPHGAPAARESDAGYRSTREGTPDRAQATEGSRNRHVGWWQRKRSRSRPGASGAGFASSSGNSFSHSFSRSRSQSPVGRTASEVFDVISTALYLPEAQRAAGRVGSSVRDCMAVAGHAIATCTCWPGTCWGRGLSRLVDICYAIQVGAAAGRAGKVCVPTCRAEDKLQRMCIIMSMHAT
jgi:hypothetical protein